jgi:hypothetical protein
VQTEHPPSDRLWPMVLTPPTPEEQVLFLRNIQRLLAEGQFTASYKFALLHAIADLCVLMGDDSGGELVLDVKDLSEKFIELYWQQSRPFELGGEKTGLILLQNKGTQAAIIRKIITAQEDFGGSLFRLKQTAPDLWMSLKMTLSEPSMKCPSGSCRLLAVNGWTSCTTTSIGRPQRLRSNQGWLSASEHFMD